jgi:hypothetical protein
MSRTPQGSASNSVVHWNMSPMSSPPGKPKPRWASGVTALNDLLAERAAERAAICSPRRCSPAIDTVLPMNGAPPLRG